METDLTPYSKNNTLQKLMGMNGCEDRMLKALEAVRTDLSNGNATIDDILRTAIYRNTIFLHESGLGAVNHVLEHWRSPHVAESRGTLFLYSGVYDNGMTLRYDASKSCVVGARFIFLAGGSLEALMALERPDSAGSPSAFLNGSSGEALVVISTGEIAHHCVGIGAMLESRCWETCFTFVLDTLMPHGYQVDYPDSALAEWQSTRIVIASSVIIRLYRNGHLEFNNIDATANYISMLPKAHDYAWTKAALRRALDREHARAQQTLQ